MEPNTQPESDGATSWRACMSRSSSLMFVLHVHRGVIGVVMRSTSQCQWRRGTDEGWGAEWLWMTSLSRMLQGPGALGISTKVGGEGGGDRRQTQGGRTDARTPRRAAGGSGTDTTSTTLVCMSKYARVPVCMFVRVCRYARICGTHKTTHSNTHTPVNTNTHARTHTYTHAHTHPSCFDTHTPKHTRHKRVHTHIHTRTYTSLF